ncbi:MAG: hypothetical protein ACJ8GN_16345 [Longimicrobiaceae bacterium]
MTAAVPEPGHARRHAVARIRALLVLHVATCAFAALPARAAAQTAVREFTAPIVLVVHPDSAQIEQLRRRLGDEAFYITADDASFYQARAFEVLDSLRVPYEAVVAAKMRFRVGGVMKEYALRDSDAAWFVLIYDGVSEPKVSTGVDLAEEVKRLAPRSRRR